MRFLWWLCIVLIFTGCDNTRSVPESPSSHESAEPDISSSQPNTSGFKPFYVYAEKGSRENHFIPSGFMGSVKCLALNDAWSQKCYSGKTCMKITYDTVCSSADQTWAGIYWLNPANNWGRRKGGFDLRGAQKLTFWAKGEQGRSEE